jgi:hypothetical protein
MTWPPSLGEHRPFFTEFTAMAAALGFEGDWPRRQWAALACAAAIYGVAPDALTSDELVDARGALRAACRAVDRSGQGELLSMGLFRAQTTLASLISCPGRGSPMVTPTGASSGHG